MKLFFLKRAALTMDFIFFQRCHNIKKKEPSIKCKDKNNDAIVI